LQVCVDRYTAFRNYVLALKDSGAANVSLAAAATDFTKQQKRYARAAARGGGLGALAAAAGPAATAAAGSAGLGSGREQQPDGWVRELGAVDNSYAALIQQTKQRMQQKREQQQEPEHKPQQAQQQQEQQVPEKKPQAQGDEQHSQQQQQQNGYRQPLKPQQPSQEQQQQQQPQQDVLDTDQQQELRNSSAEQSRAVQAQAVCGVQRQGSGGQVAAVAAGKQVMLQPCSKVAELQQQTLEQQQQTHAGVAVVPESSEEF
jgi:hypothetical protein